MSNIQNQLLPDGDLYTGNDRDLSFRGRMYRNEENYVDLVNLVTLEFDQSDEEEKHVNEGNLNYKKWKVENDKMKKIDSTSIFSENNSLTISHDFDDEIMKKESAANVKKRVSFLNKSNRLN